MSRSRSRFALIAAALVAAIALLLWFLFRGSPAERRPGPAASHQAGVTASGGPAVGAGTGVADAPGQSDQNPATVLPADMKSFVGAAALREAITTMPRVTRYGYYARPLTKDMQDILSPNQFIAPTGPFFDVAGIRKAMAFPRTPEGEKQIEESMTMLRFETEQSRYIGSEPIPLRLAVYEGVNTKAPLKVPVDPIKVITMNEDGSPKEVIDSLAFEFRAPAKAGDPQYFAVYTPGPKLAGYAGLLRFETGWPGDGHHAQITADVHYTDAPPAVITKVDDRFANGTMLIDITMNVKLAGRYYLDTRIFQADGETPIAYTSAHLELKAGVQVATLDAYGLLFRDQKIDGPYVVKGITGYLTGPTGAGRGREIEPYWTPHTTKPYPYSQFNDKPWTSPEYEAEVKTWEKAVSDLEAKERAEAAQAAGTPPPKGGGK